MSYYDDCAKEAYSTQGLAGQSMQLRAPTFLENTTQQLERARKEVARLEELIHLLEANPETQRILELMSGNKY